MSDRWRGRFPPRSTPRRVDGGLRARSRTGSIGKSWWSQRFLDVLDSFALGNRLTRGRSYARAGQVLSLRVGPGQVTASVQGSRSRPYQVTVDLDPLPALAWARVEVALAEQAIYSAQLLAGEMPDDIEQVFAAVNAPLFPERLGDLRMRCSCPDVAVPCKHLAATLYLLAEAFDDDPFQILHWRGRDRAALLSRLRELRDATPAAGGTADRGSEPAPRVTGTALAVADLAEVAGRSLAEALDRVSPDRFWLAPVPLPDRPPTLDAGPDLLLRQLPPPGPELGGPALVEALRAAYLRFAGGEPPEPRTEARRRRPAAR